MWLAAASPTSRHATPVGVESCVESHHVKDASPTVDGTEGAPRAADRPSDDSKKATPTNSFITQTQTQTQTQTLTQTLTPTASPTSKLVSVLVVDPALSALILLSS